MNKIIRRGRNGLAALLCAGALGCLVGCDQIGGSSGSGGGEGRAPGISAELQEKWPIWKQDDLEINTLQKGAVLVAYKHQFNVKPDFYRGSMPLEFESTQRAEFALMGLEGPGIITSHKFKDFGNYFIYERGFILNGAVAVNNDKKMVAEARINYSSSEKQGMIKQQITMEEFHYSGGLLVFHCMSEVDPDFGMKKKEYSASGRKQRDYFFILPIGLGGR